MQCEGSVQCCRRHYRRMYNIESVTGNESMVPTFGMNRASNEAADAAAFSAPAVVRNIEHGRVDRALDEGIRSEFLVVER